MFIYKKEYDLPDIDIVATSKLFDYKIWHPNAVYLVLGRSDKREQAILKQVNHNNSLYKIYVLKRPSGGHSVVLTPHTIVVSAVSKDNKVSPKQMFRNVNSLIIKSLQNIGIKDLHENGISDITIQDKKILGSSMYKSKDYLFYHSVLNVSESPEFISSLLAHPRSEPKYRKNRSHIDFITSIQANYPKLTIKQIKDSLNNCFCKTNESLKHSQI